MSRAPAMLCVISAACAPGPDPTQRGLAVPLLDARALAPIDAASDPLPHHRPETVDCPWAAWGPEAGAFEVQTGVCDYAAFAQPLDVAVGEGDWLDIRVWHDTLDAAEPATGHVAVLLGEQLVWERTVEIPAESAEIGDVVELVAPVPDDAGLQIHLHNHGYNSWRFVRVDLLD